MAKASGPILIAAGGTGGHLFPAEALALELRERGHRVHLATDHRVEAYGHDFPADSVRLISSATITRSPVAALRAMGRIASGFMQSRALVRELRPAAAIGFGGYPTLPPVFAASLAGVPTVVHEANAVLGRANKALAGRVTRLATSFHSVRGAEAFAARTVQTGNPVRAAVRSASAVPYPVRTADGPFVLTVFGGSQGARFLSDLVPAAVASLPKERQRLISVVQQCRQEDIERVRQSYDLLCVAAELQPFFADMPALMAKSHLLITRSGASTCAELGVVGRPAIMIPLPGALDQDQKANAEVLSGAGGGWMIPQSELTSERLGAELDRLIQNPAGLEAAASAARATGRPDAVRRLADLVEEIAR